MKYLYLVRHAKSSWGDLTLPDFDRPLNERGKKDAPDMANRLSKKIGKPDAFVSSPAKRAKKTCRIFCDEFGISENKIIYLDELYHASESTFYDVISGFDNDHKHVLIFSHNPGITDFANGLCENVAIANMPTCSIFGVKADIKKWSDFKSAKKEYLFFDFPKNELPQ